MPTPDELAVPRVRMTPDVDVQGAFNNCFFHCYALHLLVNGLPLPADLFTPNSELNKDSPVEQLKEILQGPDGLEIFNRYQQKQFPDADANPMLAEKTLVLGVLFREWFATQLLRNQENKVQLFSTDDPENISFLKLISAYREQGREMVLADDRMAPIFLANQNFFKELARTEQPGEVESFRTYWENQGYRNYCQYLAKPGVAVSYTDFAPVLKARDVPYSLHSKQNDSVTAQNVGDATKPRFELVISERAGHYLLRQNDRTAASLNGYVASLDQYKEDRATILAMQGTREQKRQACRGLSSQLVGAICPKGVITNNPTQLLVETVANIKSKGQKVEHDKKQDDALLTEKEQQILQATISASQPNVDSEKYRAYKEEVKSLIIAARYGHFSQDSKNSISKQDIDKAEAVEGETDEDFAKRLQDAEFKGAGLS